MNYVKIIYYFVLSFYVLNFPILNAQRKFVKQDLSSNYGSVCGTIRDTITNIPLSGITCMVDSTSIGAATNNNGYYFIKSIPKGCYRIKYSCVGYDRVIKSDVDIYPGEVKTIDVTMRNHSYFGADRAKQELTQEKATLWLGGLIIGPIPDSTFTDKYGFRYVLIGCDPTGEDKHNDVIEEYLERRNGKGWYDKLAAEWKKHLDEIDKKKDKIK